MPYEMVEQLLEAGQPDEALRLVAEALCEAADGDAPRWYYLQGRAHMKCGAWGKAMTSFREAEARDPKGLLGEAARQSLYMLRDILEFRNKDLYNQ